MGGKEYEAITITVMFHGEFQRQITLHGRYCTALYVPRGWRVMQPEKEELNGSNSGYEVAVQVLMVTYVPFLT